LKDPKSWHLYIHHSVLLLLLFSFLFFFFFFFFLFAISNFRQNPVIAICLTKKNYKKTFENTFEKTTTSTAKPEE